MATTTAATTNTAANKARSVKVSNMMRVVCHYKDLLFVHCKEVYSMGQHNLAPNRQRSAAMSGFTFGKKPIANVVKRIIHQNSDVIRNVDPNMDGNVVLLAV